MGNQTKGTTITWNKPDSFSQEKISWNVTEIKLLNQSKLPKAIATAYGSLVASSERISKECLTATGSANETL